LNHEGRRRGEETEKTGDEIVISSCPFCESHIAEHTDKPVKNITTVLLEGYKEKDRKNGIPVVKRLPGNPG